jgi:serine/threonine-protein kinase
MNSEKWKKVQTLFKELVDLEPETRYEKLESVKTEDPLLFEEVMSLLSADSEGTSILDGLAIDKMDITGLANIEGTRIGPFEIKDLIGSGGMGNVYLAHRVAGGFEQTVALKLIRHGIASEQAIRRFETERNILARLQHPHIARLVDGGLTSDQQPWFAMEYVEGEDLLSYCSRLNLDIKSRLRLFLDITEAVQHAHKFLVIHHDLKPGNILVSGDEEKPFIKLLDFGISRFTGDSETENTGIKAMTRAYASPEQLRGESTSTATDIYSLGVVLYQLLAGCHPKEEFRTDGCSPVPINRELEAICRKAMQDKPAGRFENISDLSEDIKSWMQDKPVLSYSGKQTYRIKKAINRNRAATATSIFSVIIIVVVILLYTFELQKETERARIEAETSEQIAGFLQGLFENADPAATQGDTLTAFAMLERGAIQVEEELQSSPEILARMYDVLGDAYTHLWDYKKAEILYKKSLDLKRTLYPDNHIELGKSHQNIGNTYMQDGRLQEADSLMTLALQIRRQNLDPDSPEIASTLQNLGFLNLRLGDIDQAETLYNEALSIYELGTDEDSALETASLINSLGMIYERKGDYDTAVENYRTALEYIQNSREPDHVRSINYLGNLGFALHLQGNTDEGEEYLKESMNVAKRIRGEDHPHTAMAMSSYASFLFDQSKYEESEVLTLETLRIYLDSFGPDHPAIPVFYNNLGNTRNNLGDFEEALSYHQQSLDRRIQIYGERHPQVAQSYANMATTFSDMEQYPEALDYYNRALNIELEVYGESHPEPAFSYLAIGNVYKYMKQADDAEQFYFKGYGILSDVLGKDHFETDYARNRLVSLFEETGQDDKLDALMQN